MGALKDHRRIVGCFRFQNADPYKIKRAKRGALVTDIRELYKDRTIATNAELKGNTRDERAEASRDTKASVFFARKHDGRDGGDQKLAGPGLTNALEKAVVMSLCIISFLFAMIAAGIAGIAVAPSPSLV